MVTLWGASFTATRVALRGFTPAGLAGLRLALGAFALLAVARLARRPLLPVAADRGRCVLLGLVIAAHMLLQAAGLTHTSAVNTGWIIGFGAIPIALGAQFLPGPRLMAVGWLGIAIATAGVAWIVRAEVPDFESARTGDLLQVASCFTWATFTLAGARAVARSGSLAVNGTAMAVAALVLSGTAAVGPGFTASATGSAGPSVTGGAGPWLAALYLGLVCSGACFWLWWRAVAEHGAARTGSYLYLEPFASVAVAVPVLGEPITAAVVAGGLLVLLGVWTVARGSAAGDRSYAGSRED